MQVFVTGGTGFIGSAIIPELLAAGHAVTALARSDAAAAKLDAAGATPIHGSLDDLDVLRRGAEAAGGIIHVGYNHDFSDMSGAGETDRRAIETFGDALAQTGKPLVVAGGTLFVQRPGRAATEDDALPDDVAHPRRSEQIALSLAERGVRSSVVRLAPSVHGEGDHGFVPVLVTIARTSGVSAYIGDGANRWPAIHRLDAARLFRLALESAPAGSRVHGVADEGIPTREIAAAIAEGLGVPLASKTHDQAPEHFGFLAMFFGVDNPVSNARTRALLHWEPSQPGLLADLAESHYFQVAHESAQR